MKQIKMNRELPTFPNLIVPNGFLSPDKASLACWYYYTLARKAYEEAVLMPIVYEGHKDPEFALSQYKQLWNSIASLYEVDPAAMNNAWKEVDMQCIALNLPTLPATYRFDGTIVIDSSNLAREH